MTPIPAPSRTTVPCPQCGQADASRPVRVLVETSDDAPIVGQTSDDPETTLMADQRNLVAPSLERERLAWLIFGLPLGMFLGALLGMLILYIFFLIVALMGYRLFTPLQAWLLSILGIISGAVVFPIVFYQLYTQPMLAKRRMEEVQTARAAQARWRIIAYCARDELFFAPETAQILPSRSILDYQESSSDAEDFARV